MQGIVDIVNYLKSSTPTVTVYRTRNPQSSDYYKRVEDHFETSLQVYEERFEKLYGFSHSYIHKVIYRYLDCGDLHNGFARSNKCRLRAVILAKISNLKLRTRYYQQRYFFMPLWFWV